MKYSIFFSGVLFLFIVNSCKEQPPQYSYDADLFRNYNWSVDTLPTPYGSSSCIWGTSENDVWVVGDGMFGVCHYNGERWQYMPFLSSIHGYNSLIFGNSPNNVWTAPQNEIWNYDGVQWKKYCDIKIDGYDDIQLFDCWINSSNDMFAVGYVGKKNNSILESIIIRFDGTKWLPVKINDKDNNFTQIKKSLDNLFYLTGYKFFFDTTNSLTGIEWKLYEFDGVDINEIKGFRNQVYALSMIGDNVYMSSAGGKIYKISNSRFELIQKLPESIWKGGEFSGRNPSDLVLYSSSYISNFKLLHFNGYNIKTLYDNPNNMDIRKFILFEKDLFVCANYEGVGLVLHGKLKK